MAVSCTIQLLLLVKMKVKLLLRVEDTGVTQRRRVLKKVAAYCQLFEQKVRDLGMPFILSVFVNADRSLCIVSCRHS